MVAPKMTLPRLMDDFDTDAECRQALEELRWPGGVCCLRCGSESISRIRTRKQFDCNDCRYRFSVTTGTVFNDSHLALSKWFMAVLLMCEAKKGLSANQMKRTLGVAHKTGWYLCHRIREAMTDAAPEPLSGTVEVDETYIGGSAKRNTRIKDGKNWRDRKTMVAGAVQRGGQIRLTSGGRQTREHLHGFIAEHVADNCERIYTDEAAAYRSLSDHDTRHETVDHSKEEYVRGTVHTNTIEGAFGLFKRALTGSFHQVSTKHLDRYLDEFEFRYNNRKNPYLFRETLRRMVQVKALPYEKLTA
jgi:transposase-like protein